MAFVYGRVGILSVCKPVFCRFLVFFVYVGLVYRLASLLAS